MVGIPDHQGCLFVIMAQPGLGKSQMMMNIGYQWLQQSKNVLMISLEMSQKMYSSRMSALFSDICVNELKDHTEILKKKIDTFKAFHTGKLYIKQFSPNEFNSNKLKNLLDKLKKNKNYIPDLIIVDYINIMTTNGPSYGMKSYQRVGYITKELRALSIEQKIPVISATQINRCLLDTSNVIVYRNKKEENIQLKDIKIGDLIKSNNGYNKIIDKWQEEQDIYEIKLKSNKSIICSSNHLFPSNIGLINIENDIRNGIKLISENWFTKLIRFLKLGNICQKYLYNDQIISVKHVGKGKTIDISTTGNRLFYANNILTHNSGSSGGYATEDVSMSNTSESASINMDADCLFALYQMDGDREAGRINVKILKNRLGGFVDTSFPMMVNYLTLKITDWDDIKEDDNNILPQTIEDKLAKANDERQINTIFSDL